MPMLRENKLTQLPPRAPSGLVKTGRYTALIVGIVYGTWRLKYLTKKELQNQEDEKEIREYITEKKQAINNYLSTGEEYFLWKTANQGAKEIQQFEPSK